MGKEKHEGRAYFAPPPPLRLDRVKSGFLNQCDNDANLSQSYVAYSSVVKLMDCEVPNGLDNDNGDAYVEKVADKKTVPNNYKELLTIKL